MKQTVNSGLCYIGDLIFFENNINQPIVPWVYIIYFHILGFFKQLSAPVFGKDNSKEIVYI